MLSYVNREARTREGWNHHGCAKETKFQILLVEKGILPIGSGAKIAPLPCENHVRRLRTFFTVVLWANIHTYTDTSLRKGLKHPVGVFTKEKGWDALPLAPKRINHKACKTMDTMSVQQGKVMLTSVFAQLLLNQKLRHTSWCKNLATSPRQWARPRSIATDVACPTLTSEALLKDSSSASQQLMKSRSATSSRALSIATHFDNRHTAFIGGKDRFKENHRGVIIFHHRNYQLNRPPTVFYWFQIISTETLHWVVLTRHWPPPCQKHEALWSGFFVVWSVSWSLVVGEQVKAKDWSLFTKQKTATKNQTGTKQHTIRKKEDSEASETVKLRFRTTVKSQST